jgi:hypothetical protein
VCVRETERESLHYYPQETNLYSGSKDFQGSHLCVLSISAYITLHRENAVILGIFLIYYHAVPPKECNIRVTGQRHHAIVTRKAALEDGNHHFRPQIRLRWNAIAIPAII